ncbi:kinase-like protein [Hypoxylon fuscum]|nr:kinase-like protein [Hypoxylon fuscum]
MTTTSLPEVFDYGYYVDEDDECDVESESEPRERYDKDLYCPLRIGQVLGQRYRIEHKLGWGGFSTVWLARDLHQGIALALKVMSPGWRGEHERQMNDEIIRRCHPDTSNSLITYLAAFYVTGRRGHAHQVLVFPWRGPSLQINCIRLPATFRFSAARHLLVTLKRLHDGGIVHTDINEGAVMWDIGLVDGWSTAEIYQRLGRPRKVSLDESEGNGELVEPVQYPNDMLRPFLRLGDFGHSIVSGTVLENPIQFPLHNCAPERFHGGNASFASDMWSFTQVLIRLYIGVGLVYGDGLSVVSRLVGSLGPFPEQWKGRYPENAGYAWWYDQTGQMPRNWPPSEYETMEHKIDRCRPDISPDERKHALAVFRKGLQYIPEKRITATQLLEDPSFNALMSFYEV